MVRTSLEEVRAVTESGKYKCYPVSCELLADIRTPIELLKILKNVSAHCFMLESAEAHEQRGRYTFLGYDPKLLLKCRAGEFSSGDISFKTDRPEDSIRQVLAEYSSPKVDELPPFTGGLVGYFAYDFIQNRDFV